MLFAGHFSFFVLCLSMCPGIFLGYLIFQVKKQKSFNLLVFFLLNHLYCASQFWKQKFTAVSCIGITVINRILIFWCDQRGCLNWARVTTTNHFQED